MIDTQHLAVAFWNKTGMIAISAVAVTVYSSKILAIYERTLTRGQIRGLSLDRARKMPPLTGTTRSQWGLLATDKRFWLVGVYSLPNPANFYTTYRGILTIRSPTILSQQKSGDEAPHVYKK